MTSVDLPGTQVGAQVGAAAQAAAVEIHTVAGIDELSKVEGLFERIWGSLNHPPVTIGVLRALAKAGNYIGVAYADDVMVGACVGFFAAPADRTLHSHIAGVLPGTARRGVGYALKLHQRAWALERGIGVIEWTFDPLVARNAYFNLAKLAGECTEYLPNFYGGMQDRINAGDDSDRLLLRWDLRDPDVVAACSIPRPPLTASELDSRSYTVALGRGLSGEPVIGSTRGDRLLVAVPPDVEVLRMSDPQMATEWRRAIREVLGNLLESGTRATNFTRDGWYVLDNANPTDHDKENETDEADRI